MTAKEILAKLIDCVNNPIDIEVDPFTQKTYHIPNYFCLGATTNDCKVLLDHITNLQQENEELKQINEEHRKLNGELRNCIDKAIEYIDIIQNEFNDRSIKENNLYIFESCLKGVTKLLNIKEILKGDSNV